MTPADAKHWVDYLLDAADRGVAVEAISSLDPGPGPLGVEEAYQVQACLLERRLGRGETLVGAKLGFTSLAKQRQMGVSEPVYGWLTDRSILAEDDLRLSELIHPRAEPEIVFYIREDLAGADVSADDVIDATCALGGGIEVIDSRYKDFRFSLSDVIADNTSVARVRLGAQVVAPEGIDLSEVRCSFDVDGDVVASATGAELLGGPAACVALLVRHLHRFGRGIEAGWTVLAGAPTDAQHLSAGMVVAARYSHFGEVKLRALGESPAQSARGDYVTPGTSRPH